VASRAAPVVLTKLHPPPLRTQALGRDRLVERLRAGPGTKVTLVAKPTRGWRFVKWGGACTGKKVRCTVNMTTVKTARVTFARIRR